MVGAGKGAKVGEQKRDYKLPVNTEGSKADKETGSKAKAGTN